MTSAATSRTQSVNSKHNKFTVHISHTPCSTKLTHYCKQTNKHQDSLPQYRQWRYVSRYVNCIFCLHMAEILTKIITAFFTLNFTR